MGGHVPETDGPHYIEQSLLVYLKIQNGRWVVDGPDTYPAIDGGARNAGCECGDEPGCEAARKAADDLGWPDADELAELLRNAADEERAELAAESRRVAG